MMLYSKYISRQLIHVTLLIVVSLTSIVWLLQALRYIDFIVNQGVSIWLFLKLTSLLIPRLVLLLLPAAFFCAIIFTYQKLKSESELVVMQSMGLGRWRLTLPALRVCSLLVVLSYAISFYVQPLSMRAFRDLQLFLRDNYVSILLQEGVFSSPVNGLTVFIRERNDDGTLKGILVQDSRKEGHTVTMMADKGALVQTPSGPRFIMENGNRQEVNNGKLSFLNYDYYALDISLYDGVGQRRIRRDAEEMYPGELLGHDASADARDHSQRILEIHQRILWPAYLVTYTLLALAFLLTGEFSRRSNWKRLTVAALSAALLLFSFTFMKNTLVKAPQFSGLLYGWWLLPTVLALVVVLDLRFKRRSVT